MCNHRCHIHTPNTTSYTAAVRKATFAFVVACLFSVSSSLSLSQSKGLNVQNGQGKKSRSPVPSSSPDLPLRIGASSLLPTSSPSPRRNQTVSGGHEVEHYRLIDTQLSSPSQLVESFYQVRKTILRQLREGNDFEGAKMLISGMIEYLRDNFADDRRHETLSPNNSTDLDQLSPEDKRVVSETVDEAFQAFFSRAFAPPFYSKKDLHRVRLGIELLQLQLSSSKVLIHPFGSVPKRVIVQAITAVTSLQERQFRRGGPEEGDGRLQNGLTPDVAFRLLQRLVTGVGVRNFSFSRTKVNRRKIDGALYEVDFNRVLNVYSNLGEMDMVHRVIALQERTPHAPPLSPVTYSILVKGYGKLGDWNNIDMLLRHAAASDIEPDTILFNSLMDAYITCNQLDKAQAVFDSMVLRDSTDNSGDGRSSRDFPFAPQDCPPPNLRSFNILLKGLALKARWNDARKLSEEMKRVVGLWDHVTTNTLVQAAVRANDFEAAENILAENTMTVKDNKQRQHPNADGYTSLIEGFLKDGRLENAVATLKTMKNRNVQPNEYHYASLIGGLARQKKIVQAEKLLSHVQAVGIAPSSQRVIYNSLISGLIHKDYVLRPDDFDKCVDRAVSFLRDMIGAKVIPDANTVTVILDGFGRCQSPRIVEAVTLVEKLEQEGIIAKDHSKIQTALLGVFAAAGDLKEATKCFRRIRRPDVAAVNALIDASVRCGKDKIAMDTFDFYFRGERPRINPDVISFTTLIGAYLNQGSLDGARIARELYHEMKFQRRLYPDKVLVDIIVTGVIENTRRCGVQAPDARFLAAVLRDAEKLDWGEGQLRRRKWAVESAMSKHVAVAWNEEAELYGLWKEHRKSEEEFFQRRGWNKVDSGFRLWGAGRNQFEQTSSTDKFLESKGWNDIDSGFRII